MDQAAERVVSAAQGVGGALLEEFVYDETGQLLNASLLDYQLPTSLVLGFKTDFCSLPLITPRNHKTVSVK